MKNATTIFYQNSFGILCQWVGEVIGQTATSIDIRFSKSKAFRYDLKQSGFILVTKTKVKDIDLSKRNEFSCCDEKEIEMVVATVGDNVAMCWKNNAWA